ncbi:MAG: recombinase family protein [Desulfovibrionaceae bacterium]|nr:recombinase family protein [Desulfovibrionaceae bacterium]
MTNPAKTNSVKTNSGAIRCAIYTRKSTEEGLEQEFNTLDAQRESAEAYIASQRHEGWACLPDRYDDGGFSGGNLERPALKRLMCSRACARMRGGITGESVIICHTRHRRDREEPPGDQQD